MKKTLITILIILLLILIGVWTYYLYFSESENNQSNTVPIEEIFDDKVVYTTEQDIDTEKLEQDCAERGGEFNTCGSICPSDAAVCAEVCAYTCELGGDNNGDNTSGEPEQWITYQNAEFGFSMRYPDYMDLSENDNQVRLAYWGPTQRTGTELFDGISLTVRRHELATGTDVQDFIGEDLEEARFLGEVIATVSTSTLGSQTAFRYTTRTLGVLNKIIIPMDRENNELLEIVYSTPDPQDRGYQATVDRILESFVFEQILTTRHYIFPK